MSEAEFSTGNIAVAEIEVLPREYLVDYPEVLASNHLESSREAGEYEPLTVLSGSSGLREKLANRVSANFGFEEVAEGNSRRLSKTTTRKSSAKLRQERHAKIILMAGTVLLFMLLVTAVLWKFGVI